VNGAPEALRTALVAGREALQDDRDGARERGGELALVDDLLSRLEVIGNATAPGATAGDVGKWLAAQADAQPNRRETFADVAAVLARRLVETDVTPPADGAAAVAWQALLIMLRDLYGTGVVTLGRLAFIGPGLLTELATEAHTTLAAGPDGVRAFGLAGPVLARLAVSRQLGDALCAGLGFKVTSTYDAIYVSDPPGSRNVPHVDARGCELTFVLSLEHTVPPGGGDGSALLVHRAGERAPQRLALPPGEALVLRGRGTLHNWEPLAPGERRTLLQVGFNPTGADH